MELIGVLPCQTIKTMIDEGSIGAVDPIPSDQIQPASLDLRLGDKAYRMRASFLPGHGRTIADCMPDYMMSEIDLNGGAVFEKDCVYLVELQENLTLPSDISAITNAKSSTGRLDLMTRCIIEKGAEFDNIPAGYTGPLYAEICPRSFSVLVRPGMKLNQIRFNRQRLVVADDVLNELHQQVGLVNGPAVINQGLSFSVDLDLPGSVVGYRARRHTGVIDLDQIGHYHTSEFWEPIFAENRRIILDPGVFYILISREAIHIPPEYAAEMAPYMALVGEFRVHYAGFFDPGFGHAPAGGKGARAVLEMRCHEAPFALEHGQSAGRLIYEKMAQVPEILYGPQINSNYQGQGLKLAKQFKPPIY